MRTQWEYSALSWRKGRTDVGPRQRFICLACAHIWVAGDPDAAQCPECGSENDRAEQDLIVGFARELARMGHQYRDSYEQHEYDGMVFHRYALPTSPDW